MNGVMMMAADIVPVSHFVISAEPEEQQDDDATIIVHVLEFLLILVLSALKGGFARLAHQIHARACTHKRRYAKFLPPLLPRNPSVKAPATTAVALTGLPGAMRCV
jgi:hypothetical protein